jgi:AcrR family transcriptional regulator
MPSKAPVTEHHLPSVSRERIVRAALDLLDRDGLDALSMRRIAAEVGVTAMTLYVYFRNKDELLDAVVDAGADEITLPSQEGPWKLQMSELLHEVRRALERHPGALRDRLTRPFLGPGVLRLPETALRILEAAGFEKEDAVRAYRALFSYTFGYASFSSEANAEEARRKARVALASLPEDEYPAMIAASAELTEAMAGDAAFDFGLDRLLDGLELLRRTPTH